MDVKAFYALIGESYDDVVTRLRYEECVVKYLRMFIDDPSFGEIVSGFEKSDCAKAFRGVHTLKGIAGNMGFKKLAQLASDLTEDLRPGSFTEQSGALFETLKIQYEAVVGAARKLD